MCVCGCFFMHYISSSTRSAIWDWDADICTRIGAHVVQQPWISARFRPAGIVRRGRARCVAPGPPRPRNLWSSLWRFAFCDNVVLDKLRRRSCSGFGLRSSSDPWRIPAPAHPTPPVAMRPATPSPRSAKWSSAGSPRIAAASSRGSSPGAPPTATCMRIASTLRTELHS